MTRTKTGIPGFDSLVDGGFVTGNTVLISGPSGSGKTVFGLQFLYTGVSKFNEPGVLVTLDSRPPELCAEAKQLGWDIEKLIADGTFIILDAASSKAGLPTSEKYALKRGYDMTDLVEMIHRAVSDNGAKRLVIDSLSGLNLAINDPIEVRTEVHRLSAFMNHLGVTSVFIGEIGNPSQLTRTGTEQFITHGLITLNLRESTKGLDRDLVIWKMRQTEHSLKKHPFGIGKNGIRVRAPRSKGKKS
jgi:KaiC/GvpD/RAD55 family RecA-like ATPase